MPLPTSPILSEVQDKMGEVPGGRWGLGGVKKNAPRFGALVCRVSLLFFGLLLVPNTNVPSLYECGWYYWCGYR